MDFEKDHELAENRKKKIGAFVDRGPQARIALSKRYPRIADYLTDVILMGMGLTYREIKWLEINDPFRLDAYLAFKDCSIDKRRRDQKDYQKKLKQLSSRRR